MAIDDETARSIVGDLAQQIDALVVRPEPVDWHRIEELGTIIAAAARDQAPAPDEAAWPSYQGHA